MDVEQQWDSEILLGSQVVTPNSKAKSRSGLILDSMTLRHSGCVVSGWSKYAMHELPVPFLVTVRPDFEIETPVAACVVLRNKYGSDVVCGKSSQSFGSTMLTDETLVRIETNGTIDPLSFSSE